MARALLVSESLDTGRNSGEGEEDGMRISIFGLGYVGAVSAACLARQGQWVIGVDPERNKVDLINTGASPIIESGLREMLREYTRSGHIEATTDVPYAVHNTDGSFISGGTPSRKDGSAHGNERDVGVVDGIGDIGS